MIRLKAGPVTLEGFSRAGNETYFRVPELGISLDIGRCPDFLVGVDDIFITHSHLDHALGVPYYAGQRAMQRLPKGSVTVPRESLAGFQALMRIHEELENASYPLNLKGMAPGEETDVRKKLRVRAHRSSHRVPANSYEFIEIRQKLKPEFGGYSGDEIARFRSAGKFPFVEASHSVLFYTGDTDRGILEDNEAIFLSQVLVIECTFTTPGDRDRAAMYTHLHVEDLYEFAGEFENEVIVLTHFSLRNSPEAIQREISRRCPARLRGRLRMALPEPYSVLTPG